MAEADKPENVENVEKAEKKSAKRKATAEDALTLVTLRNTFYRDNYRRVVTALLGCVIIIMALAAIAGYLAIHRPQPVYFATSEGWRLQQLRPLSEPVLDDAQVLQWGVNAVGHIYGFNFVNYREQLQQASQYFTPDGYKQFMTALDSSNNLETVKSQKLVLSAVVTKAPVVIAEGQLNGVYAWRIQMPVMITLQSASQQLTQNVMVNLLIVRASTLEKPEGVAIAQFIEQASEGVV